MSGEGDVTHNEGNLIINYLPQNVTEEALRDMFTPFGEIQSCKLITDRHTGQSLGYGFVKYTKPEDANKAIASMNGLKVQNKILKVSYARPSSQDIKHSNVYVANLGSETTKEQLEQLFSPYGTIIETKILTDLNTGVSRGVGFVRFDKRSEAEAAIAALANTEFNGKTLTVKFANDESRKRRQQGQNRYNPYGRPVAGMGAYAAAAYPMMGGYPPMVPGQLPVAPNQQGYYCLYVSNLPADTDENLLFRLFGPFGAVVDVKVIRSPTGECKGYGFVNMLNYQDAERAILYMNGYQLSDKSIHVAFKRDKSM